MPHLPPLPECEGPKLEPFTHNFEDLRFEPELVIKQCDLAHGLVVKAKLDGKTYAIKFFIVRDTEYVLPMFYPDLTKEETALAMLHSEPFSAECRAYGRLKETGQEHLAAKAYGYVKVHINERTEEMFKPIEAMREWHGLAEFFEPDEYPSAEAAERAKTEPVMGIVKEWVDSWDPVWSPGVSMNQHLADRMLADQRSLSTYPRLLRNLHQLHKHGIVLRDLHPNQYVAGSLVDLSHSWTFPHVLAQGSPCRPDWSSASHAARDLYEFQHRVIDITNKNLDQGAEQLHRLCGVEPPEYKKSNLIAYPKAGVREALRPLPHRTLPNRPLLHYSHPYNPNSDKQMFALVPWTYGPRFDPGKFRCNKSRATRATAPRARRKPTKKG